MWCSLHGLEKPKLTVNGVVLRVGSIYSLKEKAQTSMEQDGSGKKCSLGNYNSDILQMLNFKGHNNICTTLTFFFQFVQCVFSKDL
jgi:hypothetical protein